MEELPVAEDELTADGGPLVRDGGGGDAGDDDDNPIVRDGGDVKDAEPPHEDGGVPPFDAGPPIDAGCTGIACLGIYVDGKAGNNGTGAPDAPLKKIQDGINLAKKSGLKKVFIAEAIYKEKPVLVDGIGLSGGWVCSTAPCAWTVQATQNGNTVVEAQDSDGLLITKDIGRSTIIEGIRFLGKGVVTGNTGEYGAAAMTVTGGSPTLRQVELLSGDVFAGPSGKLNAIALVITGGGSANGPLLEGCRIQGGDATDQSIGILLDNKAGVTPLPAMAMVGGSVGSGAANTSVGVLSNVSSGETSIQKAEIFGGPATGQSWAVVVSGGIKLIGNRINLPSTVYKPEPVAPGALVRSYCPATDFCGGIKSISGTATIQSNYIGGVPSARSTAILLTDSARATGTVIINGNTLDGGGSSVNLGSLVSSAIVVRSTAANLSVGRVRNNILGSGQNKQRYNVYEEADDGQTAHLAALDNNAFYHRAPAQQDAAYRYVGLNGATSILFPNLKTGVLVPANEGNTNADPKFTDSNPPLHIDTSSPLVNAGISTVAVTSDLAAKDIDGDSRKLGTGVDIGADEQR